MNDLATLAAEIEAARDDIATLERLTGAPARLAQLEAQQAKAQAAADREAAQTAKAKEAERQKQLDRYSDFRVFSTSKEGSGVLHRGWTITFRGPGWDGQAALHRERMPVEVRGFRTLANSHSTALACLIERHSDRLPEEISALAPGDAWEAINELLYAERSGRVRIRTSV